ncbi:GNAT family N-acetyltransferase [Cetobacterium sp.]|uniref:GNAT family N-acetyltransferase n=1 Tax=Cetobacterium sp. TaxID=2071632 RepID=UPI003F371DC2
MIRKATTIDISKIMEIITATISEMKLYNNTQWDETYPQAVNFLKDIEEGSLYVNELDNEIRGFVCVNYVEPTEYNCINWQSLEKAMVVHRMAVNSNFRNQGVGISLLKFSEELALKNGVSYLKTDTYSINDKMNSLFKKFGFRLAGEMEFLGKEKPFYCYDKIIKNIEEEIDGNRKG